MSYDYRDYEGLFVTHAQAVRIAHHVAQQSAQRYRVQRRESVFKWGGRGYGWEVVPA